MAVLIVCGGTGGHLAPGIALGEELLARGHRSRLIVSRKHVDQRLGEKYTQLHFVAAPGAAFSLKPLGFLRFVHQLILGTLFAFRQIREFKPDAVISFGGFMTVGFAIAASARRVPLLFHEANRRPGRAVRAFSRLASRVYLPEGVRMPHLPRRRIRNIGLPLRREVRLHAKEEARQALGLPTRGKLLMVFGGSQGADVLNEWAQTHLDQLGRERVFIYCLTGPGKRAQGQIEVRDGRQATTRGWFVPFSDQVPLLLSAADLVISRAGAGSIAEIIACRTPTILVPYPHAADNHQEANARFLEQRAGCIVVPQNEMRRLLREVLDLIFNDWLLSRMRENLQMLERQPAVAELTDDIELVIQRRRFERANAAPPREGVLPAHG